MVATARVFLTGGAGFVGSHLTEHLLSRGYAVSSLDDLSTGSLDNMVSFQSHDSFRFIQGAVENSPQLESEIAAADVVYHLAATVGVRNVVRRPIYTIENNFFGAHRVLELCEKHKKRVFIFSTSEVYGKSEKLPFREENDLVLGGSHKPRWAYACSKLLDEFLARAYFLEHGTPVTVIRLFNTIGRRQVGAYGMVVPRFFEQAFQGEPMTIYGDGNQRRCFTDVRDVVESLVDLIPVQESLGEAVNIGGSQEVSILELAKQIRDRVGAESPLMNVSFKSVYGDNFEDMNRRVPCTEKLEKLLGRKLRYRLEDTLDWIYQEFLQKASQTRAFSKSAEMESWRAD